jgi:ubiquinone biosynthesis protein UbiJ
LLNQILVTFLETLLNQALRLDPPSLQALNQLTGKIIRLQLTGIELNLTLFPDNQGIIILSHYEGEVDVHIQGAPFSLLRVFLQRETTLLNNSDIIIKGKISIAQQFSQILQGLDIDWEEQIAQQFGDIAAHKFGNLFRHCQAYSAERSEYLQLNLREYLQEEARYLPTGSEINLFLNAIDTVRDDVERLEQRVQRLIRNI